MGRIDRYLARRMADPALNGRWYMHIPGLGSPERLLIESATPTYPQVMAQERFYSGRLRNYPGTVRIDGLSIIFYETHEYAVTKMLDAWRKRVVDDEGNYGLPVDYRQDIIVEYFKLTDSSNPVKTDHYYDCWPTDQQPFELSYAEIDGRLTVTAQFATNLYVPK